MNDRDNIHVVRLEVNVVEIGRLIEEIAALRKAGGGYVCFSTVHMIMESHDDAAYAAKVNAADIVVPDGMPLVWMQRRLGSPDATRVRANDLMIELCQYAEQQGLSVGFYGATLEVIDGIKERAAADFPNLKIAYSFSPPFRALSNEEDLKITTDINAADPDFLFVGLGCPKQENWMHDHRDLLSTVCLGVGASFDFFAGNIRECPPWLGRLGLEWLYRLTQEPKRLWRRYLVLNPRFMWQAAKQLLRRR